MAALTHHDPALCAIGKSHDVEVGRQAHGGRLDLLFEHGRAVVVPEGVDDALAPVLAQQRVEDEAD